jgi:DNA-binding PucR family transcriptional regulator
MSAAAAWEPPSQRVAALIRKGAQQFLAEPDAVFREVDAAVLGATPERLTGDPAISAAVMATNHANIQHWARANIRRPGAPVAPNLSPEVLEIARDVVRRGLDDTTFNTYRIGQNIAWQAWMARAFALTDDPAELRELLDITARSIFAFVDATVAGIEAQIGREREQLVGGTLAERLETVNLILEGAPITAERASTRLHYELGGEHTAAVLWSNATPEQGALEQVAEALARTAGAQRLFTVAATTRSLWTWFGGGDAPDLAAVQTLLETSVDGVRVAVGTRGPAMEGFRRGHLDALATQRLMQRMPGDLRLATYEDVQLVALAAQDAERASEFVARTLGELADAGEELRDTLRAYLREGHSASRAARVLYTHRNTVLNRLNRAQELLPAPLEQRGLQVGLALEIVHWLGPRAGSAV